MPASDQKIDRGWCNGNYARTILAQYRRGFGRTADYGLAVTFVQLWQQFDGSKSIFGRFIDSSRQRKFSRKSRPLEIGGNFVRPICLHRRYAGVAKQCCEADRPNSPLLRCFLEDIL
jgi:hypothetical protein